MTGEFSICADSLLFVRDKGTLALHTPQRCWQEYDFTSYLLTVKIMQMHMCIARTAITAKPQNVLLTFNTLYCMTDFWRDAKHRA